MHRTVEIRYKLLRGDADYGEIYALPSSPPVLRMDDSAEIKTSLSGSFFPAPEADWLTDQIRIELVIDGVEHPLGVFLPSDVTEDEAENEKALKIEAFDRCWIVKDCYTQRIESLAAGTNYLTIVKNLLASAGITLVIETPTAATLTERREDWDIGTSFLTIINDLLSEINYKPLWFDAAGYAVLEPATTPTAENIQHTLDSSTVKSLLLPQLRRETDIYRAPNKFLVICSNPDKSGPMTATAVNDNLQSPLSTVHRGRTIMNVEKVNNIASQSELQAYANHKRDMSMYAGETYTVRTALLPGFGVEDVTALHYDDIAAICVERGWEMELQVGGDMVHKLEKVVPAIG